MDSQPKEARIRQLEMWSKHNKEAIIKLGEIKDSLNSFQDHHAMVVHHLGHRVIDPLNAIILEQQKSYDEHQKELEELLK